VGRSEDYQRVKELDRLVDEFSESSMKIKDKDAKRKLIEAVLECKAKVATVLSVLSSATRGELDNQTIAQLNDVAYKAIRK
jgi:cobalamin biosynthesis Mg chelatase CobN